MAELILSTAALGILAFSFQLLVRQLPNNRHVLPLLMALLALAVILSGPLVFQVWPSLTFLYIAALPVAFLALPPSVHLYAQALTSRGPWQWEWWYVRRYWTQLLGVPLALLIITLPADDQQALFFSGSAELDGQRLITAVVFLLVTVLWLVMSLYYLVRVTLLLRRYRRELRQVFAAEAGKRLGWLDVLMFTLVLSWGYAVLVFLTEDRFAAPWLSDTGVLVLALVLVWLLCSCGLNQRPGFAEVFADSAGDDPITGEAAKGESAELVLVEPQVIEAYKYQRSALGEEQAQRIAGKVHHAVYQEALYLDPALTLFKLAEHIGVSAQYLSQTLNQTLQQSFYDYINAARVAAAKQQLQHTDSSVLTIAMAVGFNARSSFYKAFKASTGVTPAQFRAQELQPAINDGKVELN